MATLFTADPHFGHRGILFHCERPFESVAEMDQVLISNWNEAVQPDDDIWVLGDLVYKSRRPASHYLEQLNGRKHLVWGNHDSQQVRNLPAWTSSQAYAEIAVDGRKLILFHYAMRVWNGLHRGALHLYGHSHGKVPGTRKSADVGVDCWDYRPVRLDAILARMETQPEAHEIPIVNPHPPKDI